MAKPPLRPGNAQGRLPTPMLQPGHKNTLCTPPGTGANRISLDGTAAMAQQFGKANLVGMGPQVWL